MKKRGNLNTKWKSVSSQLEKEEILIRNEKLEILTQECGSAKWTSRVALLFGYASAQVWSSYIHIYIWSA